MTDGLRAADRRLVRTVDQLSDDAWSGPSLLLGWTRAHVVAHLAPNAEGLTGGTRGVVAGERGPMYRTPEARPKDINDLARRRPRPHLAGWV